MRESAIVLAKFGASMAVVLVMIALTFELRNRPRPLRQAGLGADLQRLCRIDRCWRAALTALGLMVSALTANQIVAAVGLARACSRCCGCSIRRRRCCPTRSKVLNQSVAAGALHAVCHRCDVHLGLRLLSERHAARAVPRPCARSRAAEPWSTRSTSAICSGSPAGWWPS